MLSLTDLSTDCATCGTRYSAYAEQCPSCSAPNPHYGVRSNKGLVKAGVAGGAVAVALVAILLFSPGLLSLGQQQTDGGGDGNNPIGRAVTILRPDGASGPLTTPKEELVQAALDAINKDRKEFGLPPVELSDNTAAQAHAEDVFAAKQISHWTRDGKKPYMLYTEHGGRGSVHQNVAIAGFGQQDYERCVSFSLLCEKISPTEAIKELQYEMVYNDKECCDDGHRDNILDPHRTHVSIGIMHDDYYLALVQNFENDYGLEITVEDGYVSILGPMPDGAELEHIAIYYDEFPGPSQHLDNIERKSYDMGELIASVLEPLPPGLRYQQPEGRDGGETVEIMQADSWTSGRDRIDVAFDLQPAIKKAGVYTIYVMLKDAQGRQFDATSYSVYVESTSAVVGTRPIY